MLELLSEGEADSLNKADAEFGRLLRGYYEATVAMRAAEMGEAADDDFTLFRVHRRYDDASQALLNFFKALEPGSP